MPSLSEYIPFAHQLADAAGDVARAYFRTPVAVEIKQDDSPVTRADREIESALRERIARRFPAHGMYGEEWGEQNTAAEWVWVIDPIDGTRSFITGKPLFGTLIALCYQGVPVLGVLDQPILRERWLGVSGEPTQMNGKAVRARACSALAQATLSTTSPHLLGEGLAAFERVRTHSKQIIYGADCYAYGLLAAGFIDLVIERGLKPYDFCALVPIIQGAGGVITDWQGEALTLRSVGDVIAAGDARVHAESLRLLKE